jgi:hypothetical protein
MHGFDLGPRLCDRIVRKLCLNFVIFNTSILMPLISSRA